MYSTHFNSRLQSQLATFPPLLESVDLHLSDDPFLLDDTEEDDWSTASVQRLVLAALRPCHSLTELSITMRPHSRLHLEPLQELTSLKTLTIDIAHACTEDFDWCTFHEEQIRAVAKLSSLRRLTLRECEYAEDMDEDDPMGTRWLRWFCPLPHQLQQLQEIDLSCHYLHLDHMQLLQRLPALTAIEPACMYESSIPMLQAFAERLQCLSLSFTLFNDEEEIDPEMVDLDTGFARGSWLVPHLAPCATLTQLTLSRCAFTEADATTLCQALLQLRELDLRDVGWPSFESLRHLPLLESFSLLRAKAYPLHFDAAHFKPLQRLRDLTLIGIHPLTEAAVALIDALRPPSGLLHALVDFCFSP